MYNRLANMRENNEHRYRTLIGGWQRFPFYSLDADILKQTLPKGSGNYILCDQEGGNVYARIDAFDMLPSEMIDFFSDLVNHQKGISGHNALENVCWWMRQAFVLPSQEAVESLPAFYAIE